MHVLRVHRCMRKPPVSRGTAFRAVSVFITGPAGSGKTTELLRRAAKAAREGSVLFVAPSPHQRERITSSLAGVHVAALHEIALELFPHAEIIDDVRAAELFEQSARGLFDLSWVEFLETDLDFEVPGLRAPSRFAQAAFRLCCKLREALISPEAFLESALRGATQFYAKPPNFATADLLHYTKDIYRSSLAVDAKELARQYKHEVDLAKILTKLYRAYLDQAVTGGWLTPRDAIAQAVAAIERDASMAQTLRAQYRRAFIDDAQELTVGEVVFLQRVYGERLDNVTLTFDRDSATSTFRGARPDRVNAIEGERVVLSGQHRNPYAIDLAARHLLGMTGTSTVSTDPRVALQIFRATTQQAEARFIAQYVADVLREGATPESIALLFRSAAFVEPYRDALLNAGIPVQTIGDVNVAADRLALDALAVLWLVYDPFRHDYLLRVLQGPLMGLSDSTIQTLCAETPDSQTQLFTTELPANEARSGRWDASRDIRLGLNALRGDRDADLTPVARERLQWLRAQREEWLRALRSFDLEELIAHVWQTGLARAGAVESAWTAYQQQILHRLLERAHRFAHEHPAASLGEFLEFIERRLHTTIETVETQESAGAVRLLSLDAARGREFDHIVLPNVRAGAFPRWYVPDAFLYSPSQGMIAKENVGDALCARTAKFTYYIWRTKARESYNLEERRAFVYALRRTRLSALVTTSGRSTRGISAPEFFAELQAARLPGLQDLSDRWRPSHSSSGL